MTMARNFRGTEGRIASAFDRHHLRFSWAVPFTAGPFPVFTVGYLNRKERNLVLMCYRNTIRELRFA